MSDTPTVDETIATFGDLDDNALSELLKAEKKGEKRKTLISAIEREQGHRAEAAEAKKKEEASAEKAKADADRIAELEAQVKANSEAIKEAPVQSTGSGNIGFKVTRPRPPEQAKKEIEAEHGEPKTYIARSAGTDHKQGFIAEGQRFTTTQPQGSWMELVEDED